MRNQALWQELRMLRSRHSKLEILFTNAIILFRRDYIYLCLVTDPTSRYAEGVHRCAKIDKSGGLFS